MNLLIIGRGRVGNGLSRSIRASGAHAVSTAGRRPTRSAIAAADAIVLAVSDDAIVDVAERISSRLEGRTAVVHCAGARGVAELDACKAAGADVGVMHPMASFPSRKKSPSLQGATFTVHGDRRATTACRAIATAVGARVVIGSGEDPAYHAAAALAANGAASLAFVAVAILRRLGFERRDAEHAIGGLLGTVAENVATLGVPDALTGPIVRGDVDTVTQHRRSLRRLGPVARRTYDASIPIIVRCARAAGLSPSRASRILELLDG